MLSHHTLLNIITPHALSIFFFFNDTATTEIYTLSLHDALPIFIFGKRRRQARPPGILLRLPSFLRSEEHTSELQSQSNLVCRLLLEKKKKQLRFLNRVVEKDILCIRRLVVDV